ncbi:MAG TPA: hypothetical protein VFZ58_01960 [Candidatus Saccharimonadales bacterium]
MSEFLRFDHSKEQGPKDPLTKVFLGFFATLFAFEIGFMHRGKNPLFSKFFK